MVVSSHSVDTTKSATGGHTPSPNDWDGQLPVAGLLSQIPDDWPSIFARLDWVNLVAQAFELTIQQTMVLIRIVRRSGSQSQACWESQDTMAREGRMHRTTVSKSLARLVKLGLIHKVTRYHGNGHSDAYVPTFRISHLLPSATNDIQNQKAPNHGPICSPGLHHLLPGATQKEMKGITVPDLSY